jgi:hypothetical protein
MDLSSGRRIKILWWIGGLLSFAIFLWIVGPRYSWEMKFLLVSCLATILFVLPSKKRNLTALQMADLIERFLDRKSLYPQEWNDFVERSQRDRQMDKFRKRCYDLGPLVNHPGEPDPDAVAELRSLVATLRS